MNMKTHDIKKTEYINVVFIIWLGIQQEQKFK